MKKIINIFFLLIVATVNAQNETNHWFFGNQAYLQFTNTTVENKSGSSLSAVNGTSSISDFKGDLLFYTDGASIYNKSGGVIRPSGGGPGPQPPPLNADLNSSQSCLIVPIPKSTNRYYIFTVNSNEELFYSVVDMSLNGGFGELVEINKKIASNIAGKMSAVHHKNGEHIWLAVNGKKNKDDRAYDLFHSYLIDETSISLIETKEDNTFSIFEAKGQMKFSPNAQKLAFASTTGAIVFDFDSSTGKLGDYRRVVLSHPDDGPGAVTKPHGIAFSNDSRFIYFDSDDPFGGSRLAQFDILKDRNAQVFFIQRSKAAGSLQLGRDGKIYNAVYNSADLNGGSNSVSVINNPLGIDEGEIDFQEIGVALNPNTSIVGLPNFVQSFFRTRIALNFACVGEPSEIFIDSYTTNISNVEWDFGDGNTSTEIKPMHTFNAPGTYLVKARASINGNIINLAKNINVFLSPQLNNNQKLIECDNDNDGVAFFNLLDIKEKIFSPITDEIFSFYETRSDAENEQNEIRITTSYKNKDLYQQEVFVRVDSKNGCGSITSFLLETAFIELSGIEDEFVCEDTDNIIGNAEGSLSKEIMINKIKNKFNFDNSIKLKFFPNQESLENDENDFQNDIVSKTGEIWVKAENSGACSGLGKFNFIVNDTPKIELQDSYIICFNPSIKPPVIISADSSNEKFEWKNSQGDILSTQRDFTLNTLGKYSLTVYKTQNSIECINTKEFSVVNPELAIFSNINVNTEDETNNILEVLINGNSSYEFSINNIDFFGNGSSYTFTNVEAGLRTVYVRDINNCEQPIQTKVSVIGFKKFFTPNGDGDNDFWNINGLDASDFKSINVNIFDRFGKTVFTITDLNSIGWDGNFNGKPLNANNYWFKAKIVDIDDNLIQKSGNFSLIRN